MLDVSAFLLELHAACSPASLTLLLADGDGVSQSNAIAESLMSFDQHQQRCKDAVEKFSNRISAKGWRINGDTPSDGNCCFWALSAQLDMVAAESQTHTELRKNAVNFLMEMPEVGL